MADGSARSALHCVKCNGEDEELLQKIYFYTYENKSQIFRSALREYYENLKKKHEY